MGARSYASNIRHFLPPFGRGLPRCGVGLLALLACTTPAPAALVINELLPDPAGTDSGQEFVELLNTGPGPEPLAGVSLQFANGAVGAQWETRWTGTDADVLPPGARYLLADRNWAGTAVPDREVYLGLQNGPDAVRIARDGVSVDMVGYGALTDSDLFEGTAVPLRAGLSLARRPDGRDTDDNGADFVAATPSPGAANFQALDVSVLDFTSLPPVAPRPGDPVQVRFTLRNTGTEVLSGGTGQLLWPDGGAAAWWDETAPAAERTLAFVVRPQRRGPTPFAWQFAMPGRADTLRVELGTVQVGAAVLRLNEVMAVPSQGQGEWVELQWTGEQAGDLAGYRLRDEDGDWTLLPAVPLGPGQIVLAAQDSAALAGWLAANEAAGAVGCEGTAAPPVLVVPGAWPSLNNTPPAGRLHADQVYLADSNLVVIDAVAWGGPGQAAPDRDVSLERLSAEPVNPGAFHWALCTAAAGSTPGCRNSVATAEGGVAGGDRLRGVPPLLDRRTGPVALHLTFGLAGDETGWELRLFNLWGDGVRDFGGDARGAGPRDLLWDGTNDAGLPVSVGAYLAWLETRAADGRILRREKFRLVVR